MHDVHNNLVPENIVSMFQKVTHTHQYRTRSATNQNFYMQSTRTDRMRKSFSRAGVQIWNSLPLPLKELNKIQFESESVKESSSKNP